MALISFLIPNLEGGGAERVAITLVEALIGRGHEVDLVVMELRGDLTAEIPQGARICDLGVQRFRNALFPVTRYLRKRRPDCLQVSMWPLTVIGIVACRLSGTSVRCVVSDHAILSEHYAKTKQSQIRVTMRLVYPHADARIAVSQGAAEDLCSVSGLPASAFNVIPNPITFPLRLRHDSAVDGVWPGSGRRILSVGHLKPEKDFSALLRAFAILLAVEPDVTLVIAGEGPLRAELYELAKREGIARSVCLPGFVADPWPLYAAADVFALSSREESFGNVLVEALFAGLPIVSTETIGARAVLECGRYGRLVPAGDVTAFANALQESLHSNPDRVALKARAIHLSGEAAIDAYEDILLPGA